jgi:hypothetical protein
MQRAISLRRRETYAKILEDFYLCKARYPSKEAKEQLSRKTGLSFSRVNTWFNNRRKKEQYDRQFEGFQGNQVTVLATPPVQHRESLRRTSSDDANPRQTMDEVTKEGERNRKMSIGYLTA